MSVATHKARKNAFRHDRKHSRARRDQVETLRRPDVVDRQWRLTLKTILGAFLLIPACLFTLIVLAEMLHTGFRGNLPESSAFRWFALGALAWGALFGLLRDRAMIVYVFGHEWTHMLAAKACRAQIYDWSVTSRGGWVDTDRSNTFISLSPYFVPIYTVVIALVFGALGTFVNLGNPIPLGTEAGAWCIYPMKLFYTLVGFTWSFHLTYTVQTLHGEQSDLTRNGEFFSVLLIVLLNVIIVALFLVAIDQNITWQQASESVARTWDFTFGNAWRTVQSFLSATSSELDRVPGDVNRWGAEQRPQ